MKRKRAATPLDYFKTRSWRLCRGFAFALALVPAAFFGQAKPASPPPQKPAATPTPCTPSEEDLVVKPAPVLLIADKDTGAASGIFAISNQGTCPIVLRLAASDFRSVTTGNLLGAVPATFTPVDLASKPYLDATLKPLAKNEVVIVKIDVPKISEAGEANGDLFQGTHKISSLAATRFRVPFNIKSGTPAGEEDGVFYRSRDGSVAITNDDPLTYPLAWELWVEGRLIKTGEVKIPPGSTKRLKVQLPDDLFTWPSSGMLQDDLQKAKLAVRFAPGGDVQEEGLPAKEIPYKLRLRYFNRGWQQGSNLFWIVLFLAAGAAISIALNIGIPNQTKRNAIHTQVHDLTNKINSLGAAADSSALTFLRVERSRLDTRLHEAYWFSPNLAAELPLIQQAIDLLNSRVLVISEVRDLQESLKAAGSVPPSVMDTILAACQKTLKDVLRSDLSANDIAALRAANAAVQQQIAALGQVNAALAAAITSGEDSLKGRLPQPGSPDPLWSPFLPELQEIFDSVRNATTTPAPNEYFSRDMAAQIALACADYIAYRRLLTDQKRIENAEKQAGTAKDLLQQQTYPALLKGRAVIECIRENVSPQQVLDALKATPPKAEILVTPSTPSSHDLVWLQVHFLDPALNTDAVHRQLTCKWNLENVSPKYGWAVSHYFTLESGRTKKDDQASAQQVVVEFLDDAQNPVKDGSGNTIQLHTTIHVQPRRRAGHIGIELLRTGLALLVALLGLIATAQDKIANLSIVSAILAVLILGITADTIKNLLSK